MKFAELFGLAASAGVLQRAMERDSVSGSYLFTGPEGVGKTALAMAFAQALACTNPSGSPLDSCGVCDSCRYSATGEHPELVLISPAGEATQLWQFWDRDNKPQGALQHSLPFSPSIGRKKVFIIERADTLTEAAANSILKVLEEPPPYAHFILLSPHSARLLPTILSRCQQVRVTTAPVDLLTDHLIRILGVEPTRARQIALLSEGRTGSALALASNPNVVLELDALRDWLVTLCTSSPLMALKLAEQLRKQAAGIRALMSIAPKTEATDSYTEGGGKERAGKRQLSLAFDVLSGYYRDILQLCVAGDAAIILHEADRPALKRIAHTDRPEKWMECLEGLLDARKRVEQNVNNQLVTDALVLKLSPN